MGELEVDEEGEAEQELEMPLGMYIHLLRDIIILQDRYDTAEDK